MKPIRLIPTSVVQLKQDQQQQNTSTYLRKKPTVKEHKAQHQQQILKERAINTETSNKTLLKSSSQHSLSTYRQQVNKRVILEKVPAPSQPKEEISRTKRQVDAIQQQQKLSSDPSMKNLIDLSITSTIPEELEEEEDEDFKTKHFLLEERIRDLQKEREEERVVMDTERVQLLETISSFEKKLKDSEIARIEDVKKLTSTVKKERNEHENLLKDINQEKDLSLVTIKQVKEENATLQAENQKLKDIIQNEKKTQVSLQACLIGEQNLIEEDQRIIEQLRTEVKQKDAIIETLKNENEDLERVQLLLDNTRNELAAKDKYILQLESIVANEREKVALQRGYMMSRSYEKLQIE